MPDDPEIAEILDAYLAHDGFRTCRVGHGQAVLDVEPVLGPDLILLDVRMPQKGGWEVLVELRRRSDTPIAIITALDREIDRLRGLRCGRLHHDKPVLPTRNHVRNSPMPFAAIKPRSSKTNDSPSIARVASVTCTRPATPCDSILLARLTAAPHRS